MSQGISESAFCHEVKHNFQSRSYNARYAQMLSDERKKEGGLQDYFFN